MKIQFLQVYTKQLQAQLEFYRDILKLPIKAIQKESFQVKIGHSVLKFKQKADATPYHIAFHIEAKQEKLALEWLKKKVSILKDNSEEIVDFPSWDAKSIYFYDSDQNIIEFISRRALFPSQSEKFSEKSLRGIAEIGLVTDMVKDQFNWLNQHFSLQKFTGDYETFCATGNDLGLFIIINKIKKDWFPTHDKAFASSFRIQFQMENQATTEVNYHNNRLSII